MTTELVLIGLLIAVVVGAFVANRLGEAAWKGAVLIIGANAFAFAVAIFFMLTATWWSIVLQMLGAGILGGIMKMKANTIVAIYVLATLASVIVFFFQGFLGLA